MHEFVLGIANYQTGPFCPKMHVVQKSAQSSRVELCVCVHRSLNEVGRQMSRRPSPAVGGAAASRPPPPVPDSDSDSTSTAAAPWRARHTSTGPVPAAGGFGETPTKRMSLFGGDGMLSAPFGGRVRRRRNSEELLFRLDLEADEALLRSRGGRIGMVN